MRLVSLRLWNLRSYTEGTVEFGDGVNLFEGDIGSGKSTILLAIEFALFGLAEVASASLLRHGEREGGAELVFTVRDRTVRATRSLRRTAKGAQVKECSIEVDGKETKLSSNEMRQRVLELLEYGERRNPRARLDIFTYTTYTPQEEMRTVLAADSRMHEQRKETLRRALDLEEYSVAATNLDAIRLQLDRDADVLTGMARDLDELRGELKEARGELEGERARERQVAADLETAVARAGEALEALERSLEGETRYREARDRAKDAEARLARMDGELREASARLETSLAAADELEGVRSRLRDHAGALEELEALEELHRGVEALRRELAAATADLDRARDDLEAAHAALARVHELSAALEGPDDPGTAVRRAREELEAVRAEATGLEHELGRLEAERAQVDEEVEELTSLEGEAVCPKCRQPLAGEHLEALLAENRKRRNQLSGRIREAASRSNRLAEDIGGRVSDLAGLEALVEERRSALQELEVARRDAARVEELARRVEEHPALELERQLREREEGLDADRLRDLRGLVGAVEELRTAEARLEKALRDHDGLVEGHRALEERRSAAEAESERARGDLEEAWAGWDPDAADRARKAHEEAARAEEGLRTAATHIRDLVGRMGARVSDLEAKVVQREGVLERQRLHVHVSAWLSDRIVPAVRAMERSVLALMADEMDRAASNWFGQLVEDPDLVLSIDEDFVPRVTHQDYEMDMAALSGGERTAAAFAYRLALNGLVRSHATPGQRNLLILDEPTDGFSREQLSRMGNVLSELGADQLVMVTHDRELRTFADRVYLVQKAGGSSNVSRVA